MKTLIAAVSFENNKLGISYKGKIPWYIPEDLDFFKRITYGHVVVMGRKTFQSIRLRPLPGRINIILSSDIKKDNRDIIIARTFTELDTKIKYFENLNKKIFIIGGQALYEYYVNKCEEILLTHVFKGYTCDRYFPDIPPRFRINDAAKSEKKDHAYLQYTLNNQGNKADSEYLRVLKNVFYKGNFRPDRTGIGTISMFGESMRFDISDSCPILTTKQIAWKTCIKELLWFLRGETDSNILKDQGVHIWDGNTSREFLDSRNLHHYPEGEGGKIYGWQIRHSGGDFATKTGGVDQLAYIENLLDTDPFSRRIMWNLFIPHDLNEMALLPCHYALQLYVTKEKGVLYLSALVNIRSNDLFLGNPFNIFSYYVLVRILCLRHNMKPKELIVNIGDAHIYQNHLEQVNEQLKRNASALPVLKINENIINKDWQDISPKDFELVGYFPKSKINAKMAV